MKLYLSTTSPYSRLALIAAMRSGHTNLQLHYVLPWENPADLLAVNPHSQIPALHCDDGNILTETLIIMHYLDDRVLRGGGTCAALARALPHAPQLDPASADWGHIILGNGLNYVRMRLPEIYTAHTSRDNQSAVAAFLTRDFMQKTETPQLEKRPARVADL